MRNIKNKRLILVLLALMILISVIWIIREINRFSDDDEIDNYPPPINIIRDMVSDANHYCEEAKTFYVDLAHTQKSTDNTAVFQRAVNEGGILFIPDGNYLISGKITLKGESVYIRGESQKNTRLLFTGENAGKHNSDPKHSSIIINDGFSFIYNEKKSQSITFSDLTMEYRRSSAENPITMMLLGNIHKGFFENYTSKVFSNEGSDHIGATNLDLYACCKNITINACTFINDTSGPEGGGIWVRNISSKKQNIAESETENIEISNSRFQKNSNDEMIAVYSVDGNVEKVNIHNNDFTTQGVAPNIPFSIYSSDDDSAGVVRDVTVKHNTFNIHDFNSFVLQIGNYRNTKNATSNIVIDDNTFYVQSHSRSKKIVLYKADSVSNNITITNNSLHCLSSEGNIAGITAHNEMISGNTILGPFDAGASYGHILNNRIDGSIVGISSPVEAKNNVLENVSTGISTISPITKSINHNTVSLKKDNVKSIGIGILEPSGQSVQVECSNNHVICDEEDVAYFFAAGTVSFSNSNSFNDKGIFIYKESGIAFIEQP